MVEHALKSSMESRWGRFVARRRFCSCRVGVAVWTPPCRIVEFYRRLKDSFRRTAVLLLACL